MDKQALRGELSGWSLDPAEVAKFEAMAAEWWDPHGKFKPLHQMNPVRLDYCAGQIAARFGRDRRTERPFEGLRLLDIGCGGGLLSEPMARMGAQVTGADAAARNIPVARLHAERSGLSIDYRHATAEQVAASGERFDVVLLDLVMPHMDGLAVLERLRDLDEVAYLRFASVYQGFNSLSDFEAAIAQLRVEHGETIRSAD